MSEYVEVCKERKREKEKGKETGGRTASSQITDKVHHQTAADDVILLLLDGRDGEVEEVALVDVRSLGIQVDRGRVDPAVLRVGRSGNGTNVEEAEL